MIYPILKTLFIKYETKIPLVFQALFVPWIHCKNIRFQTLQGL